MNVYVDMCPQKRNVNSVCEKMKEKGENGTQKGLK